jgi:hypothetical protein
MISKHSLVYVAGDAAESDNVGAFLQGPSGALTATSGTGFYALDVNVVNPVSVTVSGGGIYAEDSASTNGDLGQFILAVRNDVEGSLVSADGDYAPLQVDALGRLRVAAELLTSSEYAEDSAAVGGEIGNYVLSVRQDQLATSTSADGDFASFKVDAPGRLYVNQSAAIGISSTQVSVTSTSALLVAALANRTRILVQNLDNSKSVFIGASGVTASGAAGGVRVPAGANVELPLGAGVALHAVTSSGTASVAIMQMA